MSSRKPSRRRVDSPTMKGVFIVHLNDKTLELTSPGAAINLTVGWLTQNATVDGEGIVDSMSLSAGVTAYFDVDGARKGAVSCMLFPEKGPSVGLAGPVVIACWGAASQTEATVITAQLLSVAMPPVAGASGPYIHPTWPTLQ